MEPFHILTHNMWSRPCGLGLSPRQITPSNYGRAAEYLGESASVLHTSLWLSHCKRENTGKQRSNRRRRWWKGWRGEEGVRRGETAGLITCAGSLTWETKQSERAEKRTLLQSVLKKKNKKTTLGLIKCKWIGNTLLLVCDVWRDASNYPRGRWARGVLMSINENTPSLGETKVPSFNNI